MPKMFFFAPVINYLYTCVFGPFVCVYGCVLVRFFPCSFLYAFVILFLYRLVTERSSSHFLEEFIKRPANPLILLI